MLNTRGHVSTAINYNCQRVFEGSTELGVIIYGVLYRAIKNSPNGVNCFERAGSAARLSRGRGAGGGGARGSGDTSLCGGSRWEMRETRFRAGKPAPPREAGRLVWGSPGFSVGGFRDACYITQWRWQR